WDNTGTVPEGTGYVVFDDTPDPEGTQGGIYYGGKGIMVGAYFNPGPYAIADHNISITAWIKGDAPYAGSHAIVNKAQDYTFGVLYLNDQQYLNFTAEGIGFISGSIEEGNILDDEWHHVAAVRDVNAGTFRVVADGIQLNSTGAGTADLKANDFPLVIGNSFTKSEGYSFVGSMDDVRVYDYGLDANEVIYIGFPTGRIVPMFERDCDLYQEEPFGERAINFKDFAMMVDTWLEWRLWP
ncbi:LamG domain-containing protein, partial [Planctomycetota bacterium]